jgi:hypothetical protein
VPSLPHTPLQQFFGDEQAAPLSAHTHCAHSDAQCPVEQSASAPQYPWPRMILQVLAGPQALPPQQSPVVLQGLSTFPQQTFESQLTMGAQQSEALWHGP